MTLPDAPVPSAPEPAPWERVVDAIGPKLRQARQQHGLSLQQLASRSDVSAAAIHKVERGDMVPTVTTLLKLSAALGKPIGHFVDDAASAPVAVHRRAGEHPPAPAGWTGDASGVDGSALASPGGRLRAGAVSATVSPGGSSGTVPPRPGEELLLVRSGTLEVEVAGEQYRLEPGDTLHYPSDRQHSWRNTGGEPVELLCWYAGE
jgi:transcriptional regulator with XRE-family HTH domain